MMHFHYLLLAGLLPSVFSQLNKLAKAKGLKYFGSATDNNELTDIQYVSILSETDQFGQITPGNTQKWVYTEPTQNYFTYTEGDVITSFAEGNGQLLRCHNLVWYSELPTWVSSGTWTNVTLIAAMQAHIQSEVTHYKGQCYAWDVVNEAFNDDGTYRTNVFYNTIGPEYIPIAFETAALYDPDVKLYYNDYNIEYAGAKATSALNLVKSLKARNIKIDGVGLQAHLIVGETPSLQAQLANLETFIALGVEVAYTELDIRFTSLPPTAAGLSQQSTDYANTVGACLAATNCVGITVWDFTDKYSWIPSTFPGEGDACLWYANFTTHPAYIAVVNVLGGSVTSTGSGIATMVTATTKSATTKAATTKPATTKPVTTTSNTAVVSTSTTVSTGGTLAEWAQCGGEGWHGSGTCIAGTTCIYSNPYYSQCLAS